MKRAASTRRRSRADRARVADMPANNRSRLSNGNQLFLDRIDGRSRLARRYRDLYAAFLAQTAGRNDVMVRTLASMIVQREQMDVRIAKGEMVDPLNLIRVCGAISRLMTKLGIIEESPAEDGTAQAIAALRAGRDEARPA